MKGPTKPDQVVNNQNKTPGFVVQIPEGLHLNRHNHTEFYPLILPKSQKNDLRRRWDFAQNVRCY